MNSPNLVELHLSERAARDLGFEEVSAILERTCRTSFGMEALAEDRFPATLEAVQVRLDEAMEARAAVERKVSPDFGGIKDVRIVLDAVAKGVVLGSNDIVDTARTLDALARLHDVIVFQGADAPRLAAVARQIDDDRLFSKRVLRSFDEQGQITDDASPELAVLRGKVRALRHEAQEQLGSLVRDLDEQGLLRDRNFTVRNDRYVLPVKSEFQSRVEGIVHDASQTHQTVFVEPRALLQLGNRIKIARAEVEQEEQRILRELSLEIGELAPRLLADLARAGHIEAAFARGTFAARIDGQRALIKPNAATLSLKRARHPLLEHLRSGAQSDPTGSKPPGVVVGNDLAFGEARALVISGPNAGGKTVALKTAGIVSLLARAGIPAPVDDGSVIPAFACVSCAIGDAQSLEGGYSSFSGHLVVLKGILEEIDAHRDRGPVLCLLDELLAGTDPAQGAALAQSTLEHAVERGALVVATTHYERLKVLGLVEAELAPGQPRRFRNASVALDPHGRPTFHVVLDQAGTSNALEAARRYGLPESLVQRADALLSPDEKELQSVLRTLSEQKARVEAQLREAEEARARVEADSAKLERKLGEVEREAARLRKEGKRAFLDELKEARRQVAEAIEATKGPSKDARSLNKASHDLQEMEEATQRDVETRLPATEQTRPAEVKVGDVVELAILPGSRVSVVSIEGDEIVVAGGAMKMRVTLEQLRKATQSAARRK